MLLFNVYTYTLLIGLLSHAENSVLFLDHLVLEGIDLETEIATLNSYDDEPRMAIKANKKHQFRLLH